MGRIQLRLGKIRQKVVVSTARPQRHLEVACSSDPVIIIPLWNYIDVLCSVLYARNMPRSRMEELYTLAEEHDGLLTSRDARILGIRDSVLVRLAQRGRLERTSRGVYRIVQYPADRLSQYREAVLWAQAGHHGPERVALSHETALTLYGVSDVNPSRVHLTVQKSIRLRRAHPEWIAIHWADLTPQEIGKHEGIPITTLERSIMDVLSTTHRVDIARKAVADATRQGLLTSTQAGNLRKLINRYARELASPTEGNTVAEHEPVAG